MRWEFRLPDLGEGIHEAEVVSWLVQPGEEVTEDQTLAEIETDKSIAEIPSPVDGKVVELLADEGAVVQVGQPLLVFEVESVPAALNDTLDPGNGAELSPEPRLQAQPHPQPQLKAEPDPQPPARALPSMHPQSQTPAQVTPVVQSELEMPPQPGAEDQAQVQTQSQIHAREQALAQAQTQPKVHTQGQGGQYPGQEQGNDRGQEQGEGQGQDQGQSQAQEPERTQDQIAEPSPTQALPYVRRLARDLGIDITTVAGTGPNDRVTQPDVLRAAAEAGRSPDRVPLRGIRRATALNMARSFYTAPHAAVMEEVEVGELVRLREILLPQAEARQVKLTYLPFIIMATVRALQKHPYMNASLDDERQEIILRYEYNIGIATDTPGGLLVPVIKGADTLDLWGLAAEIERLAGAARRQRLEHRDMQNGTFTITNVGPLGGVWSVPIIRHPEVAILAVHRIQKRPVVRGERVEVGQMLNLVLTFDHRVVDGADALRFLKDLRLYLEHPALIFMPGV